MAFDFTTLRSRYMKTFGFHLGMLDPRGEWVVPPDRPVACACGGPTGGRRLQAAEQTRYWGETVITLCCDSGHALWAVPILDNNRLSGALAVQDVNLEQDDPAFHERVRSAADHLLKEAVRHNLVNQAEIELAQKRAHREQGRFLAIEARKGDPLGDDIRNLYLDKEPDLLAAIRQGRIQDARSLLNRILTGVYGHSGSRMDLLKSSVMELVVMMNRAAVEAGADPCSTLGRNYRSLVELSTIEDEEDLADWIRQMLDSLIREIQAINQYPHSLLLMKAMQYMRENLHQHLRRDEVAKVAGISPSHFSRITTERIGQSFSSLLTDMRVSRARELLAHSNLSLTEIAMECGFFDQSHFSKVFRSRTDQSPGEFRSSLP